MSAVARQDAAAAAEAMRAKEAAFALRYPPDEYVVVACDPGRCTPLAVTFPDRDGKSVDMSFSRHEYYAAMKVEPRKLLRKRWVALDPVIVAARGDLAQFSRKTASPAALADYIAAVGRHNAVLWPFALRRRNAQLDFACGHRAKFSFLDRWCNRVSDAATLGGKRKLLVAYGAAQFPATGRGEPGGAPTTALKQRCRLNWNLPGASFNNVDERLTSQMSHVSKGRLADVADSRRGHCLEKRARRDAKAARWAAWAAAPPRAAPAPLDVAGVAAAAPLLPAVAAPAARGAPGAPRGGQALALPLRPFVGRGRSRRAAQRARAAEESARRAAAANRAPPLLRELPPADGPMGPAPLPAQLVLGPPALRRSRRSERRREWARGAVRRREQPAVLAPPPPVAPPAMVAPPPPVAPPAAAPVRRRLGGAPRGPPRALGAAAAAPPPPPPAQPAAAAADAAPRAPGGAAAAPAAAAPVPHAALPREWPTRGVKFDPIARRFLNRDANSARLIAEKFVWQLLRGPGDPDCPPHLAPRGERVAPLPVFQLRLRAAGGRAARVLPAAAAPPPPPAAGAGGGRPGGPGRSGALAHSQRGEP